MPPSWPEFHPDETIKQAPSLAYPFRLHFGLKTPMKARARKIGLLRDCRKKGRLSSVSEPLSSGK